MYFLPYSSCLDWICIPSFLVTRNDFAKSMWTNLLLPSFFLLCLYVGSLDSRGYSVSARIKHLAVGAPDDGKEDGIISCCELIFSCIISVYTWHSFKSNSVYYLSKVRT